MAYGINRHPDDEEMERYSMGSLPSSGIEEFEEHLLVCESCRQRLDTADDYAGAMKRAAVEFRSRENLAPAARRAQWTWLRLVPALAAVALLAAVLGWWSRGSDLERPPFAISLAATRGADAAAFAPANTRLLVRLDLAGVADHPSYSIEMVNASGAAVWRGAGKPVDAKVESPIPHAKAGAYFIRVYSPAGELLREFGLNVK